MNLIAWSPPLEVIGHFKLSKDILLFCSFLNSFPVAFTVLDDTRKEK